MHRHPRTASRIVLVVAAALLLRADSCTTTDRAVEVPVPFQLVYDVDVRANTAVADTVTTTVDLAAPMLAALAARESDDVPAQAYWASMAAVFTRNDGHDTTRGLRLTIADADTSVQFASTPTREPIPNNRVGTTALVGGGPGQDFEGQFQLIFETRRVGIFDVLANEALDEYRETGDITPRDVSLIAVWDNDRDPGDPADDFTLRVALNFQVADERQVEVYNP